MNDMRPRVPTNCRRLVGIQKTNRARDGGRPAAVSWAPWGRHGCQQHEQSSPISELLLSAIVPSLSPSPVVHGSSDKWPHYSEIACQPVS